MRIYESDWLGFKTYFYNEKTKKVSSNINDVIDYENLELDNDGLLYYLRYGYSVFGITPVRNVKFLLPHSRLIVKENSITVETLPDPCLNLLETASDEVDVLNMIKFHVNEWEKTDKKLIVPTSGGYDSRLLDLMVEDKSRINAFGYGVSSNQEDSLEIVYAKEVCKVLDIDFKQIFLGDFHKYCEDWYSVFGPSVHFHGMYHFEFYNKIKQIVGNDTTVLSGIIGDAWAGKSFNSINSPDDVFRLGLSYTYCVNPDFIKLTPSIDYEEEYFERKKDLLKVPQYRVIESMRFKMMLLRYLMLVPESLGMDAFSPFLDIEVATSMLNLRPERRNNRQWQFDFFRKNNVAVEDHDHLNHYMEPNTSDLDAQRNIPLGPVSKEYFQSIIDYRVIDFINNSRNENINAYCQMNVLLSIQNLMNLGIKND